MFPYDPKFKILECKENETNPFVLKRQRLRSRVLRRLSGFTQHTKQCKSIIYTYRLRKGILSYRAN